MYHPILLAEAQRKLKQISRADLVIGLPSHKNRPNAVHVARTALEAVRHFYPGLRAVVINADAGRSAATRQAVAALNAENGHAGLVISSRYNGPQGYGSATAALLDAALALDAQAIVLLDTTSGGLSPDWVAGLASLVLAGKADLVLPRYRQWAAPEGQLGDLIVYPLFRAVWGRSVRYPTAPDFALSPRLATRLLDEDVWGTAAGAYGLAPWLVTYAVVKEWRVAQTAIGAKQNSRAQSLFTAAGQTQFHDVVSVLFRQMGRFEREWQQVNGVQSLPTLTEFAQPSPPQRMPDDDPGHLLDNLALGWMEYRKIWQQVLTARNLAHVESLAALPPEQFYFPSDLWAKILYDFVTVFNHGELDPQRVVLSLVPLYLGRLAAFQQEVAGLAVVGREGTVAAQAVEFEELRKYFKMRWQSYQSRYHQPDIDDRPII